MCSGGSLVGPHPPRQSIQGLVDDPVRHAGGDAEAAADPLVLQPLLEAEEKGFAVARGQLAQQCAEAGGLLAALGGLGGAFLGPGRRVEVEQRHGTAPPAEVLDGAVDQDPGEPVRGPPALRRVEAVQPKEEAQEGFLHRVLGLFPVVEHPPRQGQPPGA